MAGKTGPLVPLEVLRAAVAEAAEASSLRRVSTEIGMSFSGLHNFLSGGTPFASTQSKLTRWYLATRRGTAAAQSEAVEALLTLLLQHLGDSAKARTRLLDLVVTLTKEQGVAQPQWLQDLARPDR